MGNEHSCSYSKLSSGWERQTQMKKEKDRGTKKESKRQSEQDRNKERQTQADRVKQCDRMTRLCISCRCKLCPADTAHHDGQHSKHTINNSVPVYCHSRHTHTIYWSWLMLTRSYLAWSFNISCSNSTIIHREKKSSPMCYMHSEILKVLTGLLVVWYGPETVKNLVISARLHCGQKRWLS